MLLNTLGALVLLVALVVLVACPAANNGGGGPGTGPGVGTGYICDNGTPHLSEMPLPMVSAAV